MSYKASLSAAIAALLLASLVSCEDQRAKFKLTDPLAEPRPAAEPSTSASSPSSAPATPLSKQRSAAKAAKPSFAALQLTGTTVAYRQSTLAPKAGGTIKTVLVRAGQRVADQATLIVLDQVDFALALRQAKAAQAAAEARLDAVRSEFERFAALLKVRAVPQSQYDKVNAEFRVVTAAKAQADVAVAQAQRALSNTVVRAPFAGIITEVMVDEGEAATMMPPTRLLTIAQTDRLELVVQVPERAFGELSEGSKLRARFNAAKLSRELTVARVVRALDPRTRMFRAIAELDNSDGKLRAGMFASVTLLAPGSAQ
ncbi:MAG: efflux RND transporter periplasmic adaptor subunit [Deltaproteobacteria bacterium]|nr:efflux RND transporter periplasmic adaptor subunit [Deltaproteobacteria bacterium]